MEPSTQLIRLDTNDRDDVDGSESGERKSSKAPKEKPVAYLEVLAWSLASEGSPSLDDVGNLPTVYPIFNGSNFIGRSKAASICFPFSVVSAIHARIDVKGKMHTIADCRSTNETRRNEVTLEPDVRYELMSGARLAFGDVECRYRIGGARFSLEGVLKEKGRDTSGATTVDSPAAAPSNLSTASGNLSIIAATLLQNFMDDSYGDLIDAESGIEAPRNDDELEASPQFHVPECPVDKKPIGQLSMLAEETQFVTDGQSSILRNSVSSPEVVRETEFILGDEPAVIGNDRRAPTAHGPTIAENRSRSPDHNVDVAAQSQKSEDSFADNDSIHASDIVKPHPDVSTDTISPTSIGRRLKSMDSDDESSMDVISNTDDKSKTGDFAFPDTAPYIRGKPINLDKLNVTDIVSPAAATPASVDGAASTNDQGSAAPANRTSIWSAPTSDTGSSRRKRNTLLAVAAENWLFSSEPNVRRRNAISGIKRRKTSVDKPKTRIEELAEKCGQWTVAAKKAASEKKRREEGSVEKLVLKTNEVDPYEFTPTQASNTKETGSTSLANLSTGSALGSYKKTVRKSSTKGTSSGASVAPLVHASASPANSSRKRTTDEEKFDAAAKESRQQRRQLKKRETKSKSSGNEELTNQSVQGAPKCSDTDKDGIEPPPPKKAKKPSSKKKLDVSEGSKSPATPRAKTGRLNLNSTNTSNASVASKGKAANESQKMLDVSEAPSQNDVSGSSKKTNPRAKTSRQNSNPTNTSNTSVATEREETKKSGAASPTNVIICFTQLNDIAKQTIDALRKAAETLGAQIVDSGVDCTHLVVPKVARSAKFMCAVARGVPIVTPSWIEASKKAGRFVDPDEFIIDDQAAEAQFGFNLRDCLKDARANVENGNGRLFDGYAFYSTDSVRPGREEMKVVVLSAGGKFLDRLPKTSPKNGRLIIISCDPDAESDEVKGAKTLKVPFVSMEFIFTGLLKRDIDVEKYQLFGEEPVLEVSKRKGRKGGENPVSCASGSQSQPKAKRANNRKK